MGSAPAVGVVGLLASALVVGPLRYRCVGDCAERTAYWPATRWTLLVATVVVKVGLATACAGERGLRSREAAT